MRNVSRPVAKGGAEVLPFADQQQSDNMGELIATLKETNKQLAAINDVAADTFKMVKRIFYWAIPIIGVLWPAAGKIIASLPNLSH